MKTPPMVALGDVVEVKGGGTPSKANPAYWNGDIPWVSPKDMKVWNIEDAEDKITPDAVKESTTNIIPQNSILIVNRSGILKHTLPVGITRRPVAINQDLKALICGPRSHPEYIARLVKAAEPIILNWVRATTADNFPIENLRSLQIPLPALDEQRRIATTLDKADALRRKRSRALELLDRLTQSIFLEMFGRNSEYEKKPLADLVDQSDRINYGVVQPGDEVSDGVNLVRVSDLRNGIVNHTKLRKVSRAISDKHGRSLLRGNEILISCVGSIGEIAVATTREKGFNIARAVARVPIVEDLLRAFVAEYLRSPIVQEYFIKELRTVSQPTLNIKQISETLVPVPPTAKLQEFLARRDIVLRTMHAASTYVSKSDAMFSSLQSRAFSGQL